MGKVYKNKICSKCGFKGIVIESWGINYCKACWDLKPHRPNTGNGGMKLKPVLWDLYQPKKNSEHQNIILERVKKSNLFYSNLYLTHYPGSKGIMGRQFHYLIHYKDGIAGIIGANSPPLNYKKFNLFFGETLKEQNWLNNNVYRLIYQEKNLGTRVLKIFRKQIKIDYENQYKIPLAGLITFVEPPRNGAMYLADNWIFLGETQGKQCRRSGDHGKWTNKEWSSGSIKKLIFAIKI